MKKWIAFALAVLLFATLCLSAGAETAGETVIPEISLKQWDVPENEAMELMQKLGVGWNLGNTFDATKGAWNKNADEMTVEKSWCGVYTTRQMIQTIREAGFTTLRLPVSWHDHVTGDDYSISEKWMARVQQVADWALDEGLYVILNTHHDEDQIYPSTAKFQETKKYFSSVWTQIAARFKDYDEHLILESMNEPRLKDTQYEWYFSAAAPECIDAAKCINELNQLFVDIVRGSGGNNAVRYLMVPGYDASPEGALNDYFALPKDSANNRLIVSAHAYTPYRFALEDGGTASFNHLSSQQTSEIVSFMHQLYTRYISQGIPVVIGEFGARNKNNNLQDRVNFAAFYTAAAASRCLPVLWWDNNAFTGNGENFGLLKRQDCSWPYPEIVQAIIQNKREN